MLNTGKTLCAGLVALLLCTCGFAADNSKDTGPLSRELNMNARDYILFKQEVRNLNKIGQVLTREQLIEVYKRINEVPFTDPLVKALPLGVKHNYEYSNWWSTYKEGLAEATSWGDNWTYAPTYAPSPTWAPTNSYSPYTNYSPTGSTFSSYPDNTGGLAGGLSGGVTVLNRINSMNTNKNANANGNANANRNKNGNSNFGRKK